MAVKLAKVMLYMKQMAKFGLVALHTSDARTCPYQRRGVKNDCKDNFISIIFCIFWIFIMENGKTKRRSRMNNYSQLTRSFDVHRREVGNPVKLNRTHKLLISSLADTGADFLQHGSLRYLHICPCSPCNIFIRNYGGLCR
jgi:hypothetical protein